MKKIIAALALGAALLLPALTTYADAAVAGTVQAAGPIYQGRQYVCFTRADVAGRTCLPVAIRRVTYRRGQAIWVHRASGRITGISPRYGGW